MKSKPETPNPNPETPNPKPEILHFILALDIPFNPILYGLQKLHILYGGGKFTPTKLKCLYAPPKGAQLFVIGFLWCINSIIMWINNFFLVFIIFLQFIWAGAREILVNFR